MDISKLFGTISKGISLVTTLAQQGKDISRVTVALQKVVSKHPNQVTDEELDDTELELDDMFDEFEVPLTRQKTT